MKPEILNPHPLVAKFAIRFYSRSRPPRTYDTYLSPKGYWSCECWPFLTTGTCDHIQTAKSLKSTLVGIA